ncbi:MAG: leucine-rich repeat protein [Clostridia bacterium]|nr:leucine-rich repeat protein [Clostridia bacterium]
METVILAGTVLEEIQSHAFSYCESLKSIDLTSLTRLRVLGKYAFEHCSSMQTADLSGLTELKLADCVFEYCANLTTVNLSGDTSIDQIGEFCFNGCTKLSNLNLDGCTAITSIGKYAFKNCEFVTIDISKLSELNSIGEYAFSHCKSITEADFTNTKITTIGQYAFDHCTALESVDFSETDITGLPRATFEYCSSLNSISFSGCDELTEVGSYLFNGCANIQHIDFSDCDSLTSIGSRAFTMCGSLVSVDFSDCDNLTSIDSNAFNNNPLLESCDFSGDICLQSIGNEAFKDCRQLRTIDFTDCNNVTSIGASAFHDCKKLILDLSNFTNLKTIGSRAIYHLTTDNVSDIEHNGYVIGLSGLKNVETIEKEAFNSTAILDDVLDFSNGALQTIGENAFAQGWNAGKNLNRYTKVDLSGCKQLSSIGNDAFQGTNSKTLPNLQVVDLSDAGGYVDPSTGAITTFTIGDNAFGNLNGLQEVNLTGSYISSIGSKAFQNDTLLKEIVIPKTVTKIADDAFTNCAFNNRITWDAANYTSPISQNLFANSQNFVLTIGPNVAHLPENFFKAVEKASEVYFTPGKDITLASGTNTSVSNAPFSNMTGETTLYVDEYGVVYRLDSDRTASIVYCNPKPHESDVVGITSYRVPSTITVGDNSYTVDTIEKKAFVEASDLEYVVFEKASKVTIQDEAFEGLVKLNMLVDESIYKRETGASAFDEAAYTTMRGVIRQYLTADGKTIDRSVTNTEGGVTYDGAVWSKGVAATMRDAMGEEAGHRLFSNATPTGAFYGTALYKDIEYPWDKQTVVSSDFTVYYSNNTGPSIKLKVPNGTASHTTDSTIYPREDGNVYTLLTGTNITPEFTATANGKNSRFRIYVAYSGLTHNPFSDGYVLKNLQNRPVSIKKVDGLPNTYCLEFDLEAAETTVLNDISFGYPSPTSAGGDVVIWADILEKGSGEITEDDWKKGADEKDNKIYIVPHSTGDQSNVLKAEWELNRQERIVKKSSTTARVDITGDGTPTGSSHSFYVGPFGWRIALQYEDPNGARKNQGQDMVVQADVEDPITLPAGIVWRSDILDAIRSNGYSVTTAGRSNGDKEYSLNVGGQTVLRVILPGDAETEAPTFTWDGTAQEVKINWTLVNPSKITDLSQNNAEIIFEDQTLIMDLNQVRVKDGLPVPRDTEGAVPASEASLPLTFTISNQANAVMHYTHTPNSEKKYSNVPSISTVADEANLTISKERNSNTTPLRLGDDADYRITVKNIGAGAAKTDVTVSDALSVYQYITPADMEALFKDAVYILNGDTEQKQAYGEYLTITLKNASAYINSSVPNPDSTAYISGSGSAALTDETSGELERQGSASDLIITYDKTTGVFTGTFNGTTQTAASVSDILSAFDYHVDASVQYVLTWKFPHTNDFRFSGGMQVELPVYTNNKDTFMLLKEDTPVRYQYPDDWQTTVTNRAEMQYKNNKDENVTREDNSNSYILKAEYQITKGVNSNIATVTTENSGSNNYYDDPVRLYAVQVSNNSQQPYNGRSDLPVTDELTGGQLLLAPKDLNSENTSVNNCPVVTADRVDYYVLTAGDYTNVYLENGKKAAVITVRGSTGHASVTESDAETEPDITTHVTWFLPELKGTQSVKLEYHSLILQYDPENGRPFTNYGFNNVAYLNGRTHDRLFASVGAGGASFSMSKKIVTAKGAAPENDVLDEDDLTWLTVEDNSALYRVQIKYDPRDPNWFARIPLKDIYDVLPETKGIFNWGKPSIVDVKSDGLVKIGTDDAAAFLEDINNWELESSGEGAEKIWYLRAGTGDSDTRVLSMNGTCELDIYIKLTFPKENWINYCGRLKGALITNTAYVGRKSSAVHHEVKTGASAWLQKGVNYVYNVGVTGSRFEYSNIEGGVEYYTVLYNSGVDRLYLNDLVDNLPGGFSYMKGAATARQWNPSQKDPVISSFTTSTNRNASNFPVSIAEGSENITFVEARLIPSVETDPSGNQTVTFHFDNTYYDTGTGSRVKKDTTKSPAEGNLYLMPGEAIAFAYNALVNEDARKTQQDAVNSIHMVYNDPAGLGVERQDGGVKWTGCRRNDTSDQNDGDVVSYQDMGIQSSVKVSRGQIIPGVRKYAVQYSSDLFGQTFQNIPDNHVVTGESIFFTKWQVFADNTGTAEINGYSIDETIEYPFRFQDEVSYAVYRRSNSGSDTLMLAAYQTESSTSPSAIFKIVGRTDEGVQVMDMANHTTLVPYAGSAEFTIPVVKNLTSGVVETDVKFTLSFSLNSDRSEKMTLTFPENTIPVVPNGYGRMDLTTFSRIEVKNADINNTVVFRPDENVYGTTGAGKLITDGGTKIGVQNDDFVSQRGSGTTDAVKSVTKTDGTTKTSENSNDCVVLLDDYTDEFTYTLKVKNHISEPMTKLVIVDNLPQPGDKLSIQSDTDRNSEFLVKFLKYDTPSVVVKDKYNQVDLTTPEVTYEYSAKTTFSETDRTGTYTDEWTATRGDTARSIRITVSNVPANGSVEITFKAKQEGGKPGQIAYNSFAYYYEMNNSGYGVSAAPHVVGVQIPFFPTLKKAVFDDQGVAKAVETEKNFYFLIYQGEKNLVSTVVNWVEKTGDAVEMDSSTGLPVLSEALTNALKEKTYQVVKVTVPDGQSVSPEPAIDQLYRHAFWKQGEKYTIVELPVLERYSQTGWDQYKNNVRTAQYVTTGPVEFTYDSTQAMSFTAKNKDKEWQVEIRKVDSASLTNVSGAVFAVYRKAGIVSGPVAYGDLTGKNLITETEYEGTYKNYTRIKTSPAGTETWYLCAVLKSGEDGMIRYPHATDDMYLVREIQAPDYYQKTTEPYRIIERTNGLESYKNTRKTGSITIKKTVDGLSEEDNVPFTFTVSFQDTLANNGEIRTETFTLYARGGQDKPKEKTISGIPYRTQITIEEAPSNSFAVSMKQGDSPLTLDNGKYTFILHPGAGDTEPLALSFDVTNTRDEQKVSFKKVDAQSEAALSGAEFKLYQVENGVRASEALLELVSANDGMLMDADSNKEFTLKTGVYHLIETKAPAGYNLKTEPVVITVSKNQVVFQDGETEAATSFDSGTKVFSMAIPNTPGVELPATGGPGSLGYTFFGAGLALLALLAFLKRRKEQE